MRNTTPEKTESPLVVERHMSSPTSMTEHNEMKNEVESDENSENIDKLTGEELRKYKR